MNYYFYYDTIRYHTVTVDKRVLCGLKSWVWSALSSIRNQKQNIYYKEQTKTDNVSVH